MPKGSRGVGALLLELPHRETAPAAPLIGTPLLYHTGGARKRMPIRGARKEEKNKGGGGKEDRHGKGEEEKQEGWGERNNNQLIILTKCTN